MTAPVPSGDPGASPLGTVDESTLQTVLDGLEPAIVIVDERRGVARANEAAARLLGVARGESAAPAAEQALQRLRASSIDPAALEQRARTDLAGPGGQIRDWSWRFERDPRHLRVSSIPLAGPSGEGPPGQGRAWILEPVADEVAEGGTAGAGSAAGATSGMDLPGLLARAVEHSALGGAIIAPDGRFLYVNDAFSAIVGHERESLLRLGWQMITDPADLYADLAAIARLDAGEVGNVRFTTRYRRADGTTAHADVSVTAVRDAGGAVWFRFARIAAVTEQEAARRALAESRVELAEAQRVGMAGSYAWDPQTDRLVWSDEMHRLHGREPGDPVPPLGGAVDGLDLPEVVRLRDAIAAMIRTGDPYEVEYDFPLPDGGSRRLLARGEVVAGPAGELEGIRGTVVDITALAEARAALAASEERYRLLVENTPDVVFRVADGVVAWVSPSVERLLGRRPEEIVGRPLGELVHPDDQARLAEVVERLLAGERISTEGRIRDAAGGWRWAWTVASPFVDPDGRISGFTGVTRDIGELVEARELREARIRRVAERADYLARAEHTLRTNLTVVEGWADAIEESAEGMDKETLRRAAAAIGRNARTLGGLLHELMSEAAIAARLEAMELVPVDVAAVAAKVVQDYDGLDDGPVVTVEPTSGVIALGSEEALETVVRHLVENARKFSGDGRAIVVTTRRTGRSRTGRSRTELAVVDEGPGLPKAVKLFEPFTRSGPGAGHGLGLHVVRTLVEAMGGTIRAEDRTDRSGARFIVTLRSPE
ncbi:MAG: hypothetical protein RL338_137 [Chloroflexota bacterium]